MQNKADLKVRTAVLRPLNDGLLGEEVVGLRPPLAAVGLGVRAVEAVEEGVEVGVGDAGEVDGRAGELLAGEDNELGLFGAEEVDLMERGTGGRKG